MTGNAPEPEPRLYTLALSEEELHRLLSGLYFLERRQKFLAGLASKRAREREALARNQMAHETAQLTAKLERIAAEGAQ